MKIIFEASIRVGDLVNGKEIISIEPDPFIANQINLWTLEEKTDEFGEKGPVPFRIRKMGG